MLVYLITKCRHCETLSVLSKSLYVLKRNTIPIKGSVFRRRLTDGSLKAIPHFKHIVPSAQRMEMANCETWLVNICTSLEINELKSMV